jgi:hypothetical protein
MADGITSAFKVLLLARSNEQGVLLLAVLREREAEF